MKSLAICIPTYKRPDMLRECVESAVLSACSRPITIFIADDSLSEINRQVVDELCRKYPFIKYSRNDRNLGIDQNIQHVVDSSSCDYSWMIGEDDRFLPGVVARVHELIQTATQPFIFANYQYVSENHDKVIGTALPQAPDFELEPARFVEDSLWAVGFIGGCIVDHGRWIHTSPAAYAHTYFTHVGRILELLDSADSVPVIGMPCVANRAQGDDTFTWKKDSFGVFLGFEKMCRTGAQKSASLSAAILRAAIVYRRKFAYFSPKTALRLRAQGAFDWRQFKKYVMPSDIDLWRKLWFLAMSAVPPVALAPIVRWHSRGAARRRLAILRNSGDRG